MLYIIRLKTKKEDFGMKETIKIEICGSTWITVGENWTPHIEMPGFVLAHLLEGGCYKGKCIYMPLMRWKNLRYVQNISVGYYKIGSLVNRWD